MTVALPLSAGRNLSFDIFFIKSFKAARCLGVRLSEVLFGIVVCKDGGCLVNGKGLLHVVGEVFHYILDKRGKFSGGVLFRSGKKLQCQVEYFKFSVTCCIY